jgi:hypothetical protein
MDSENFENAILSEEEKELILREALENKKAKLRLDAHWERVRNPPPIPKFTSEQVRVWAIKMWEEKYNLHWIETPENKVVVDFLSRYFVGDETIENEGYSLKKGIMLIGGVGVGKTSIMQMFCSNPKSAYQIISCRNISNEYAKYGAEVIDNYSKSFQASHPNHWRHDYFGACFDDLGTETKRKNFGNEANVMEEILLSRYDKKHALAGMTHLTTNLTADQIAEAYGERVRSRLREMMNVFIFNGTKDMRS